MSTKPEQHIQRSKRARSSRDGKTTAPTRRHRFSLFVPPLHEKQVASLHSHFDLDCVDPESSHMKTVLALADINGMNKEDCSQQIETYREGREVGAGGFMYSNSLSQDRHDAVVAGPGFEVLCREWPTSPCYTAADAASRKAALQAPQAKDNVSTTVEQQQARQRAIETSGSWSQTASERPPVLASERTSPPRSDNTEQQQDKFGAVESANSWTRSVPDPPTI